MSFDTSKYVEDEYLPPPYSTTHGAAARAIGRSPAFAIAPPDSSSLFSAQLSSLRGQMREEQAAHSSAREQQDYEILSLLVPYVETLLHSIAAVNPPPSLVEATLVPDEAVSREWLFSDAEAQQNGHFTKLVRVERHLKLDRGDQKRAPLTSTSRNTDVDNKEFDGWGRWKTEEEADKTNSEMEMWWLDEDMAHRLAKHLQPSPAPASVNRQTVRTQVEQNKEAKKGGRWSFFKKDEPLAKASTPSASSSPSPAAYNTPLDDINMTVKAEEVTFRRQNDMGLWESKTGWGLVVRVNIRGTQLC
ncbi:hypothetical protein QQS21_004576 [Conoideocrella luteorostrata]|uniref:NAD dependent epimerase/dehydratase family protein n=1 Tax=Conoideocrella luteorostrata TaxID=1105319 RepID=A0AAJ0FVC9_9HYPO|nr:hypothetical protein QQS21_004576 [Conoideocrella luteorostrata]